MLSLEEHQREEKLYKDYLPSPWRQCLKAEQSKLLEEQEVRWKPVTDSLRYGAPSDAEYAISTLGVFFRRR